MLRRLFVIALAPVALAAKKAPRSRAPEDPDRLNAFAADYNRYVEALRRGVLDVAQWARVEAAWNKL